MYGDLEAALSMARESEARLTLAQARIVLLPSRIRIMRALAQKRATMTELSKRTGLSKSTVLKHLRVLAKYGLVIRNQEDRLWIYYDLTRAGRAVGRLNPLRILVMFSVAAGAALAAGAVATWWWGWRLRASEGPWKMPPIGVEPEEPMARVAAYALAAAAGALVALAGWLWWRARLPAKRDEDTEPTDTSSFP